LTPLIPMGGVRIGKAGKQARTDLGEREARHRGARGPKKSPAGARPSVPLEG